jgi:hypothetical protein
MNKIILKHFSSGFPGKMVTVNNHKLHIYTEGEGKPSLVFLSGSGTPSPLYDFKALYSKMTDKYQITVLERAGYGFSEISDVSRDIETVLFETRMALKEANINPPYILFFHSMSAIEAFYWVQSYPDEVKALIGLDPGLPIHYEIWDIDSTVKKMEFLSKIINKRFKFLAPVIANILPPIKYGTLNKTDRRICKAVICGRIITNDMINESKMIKKNARKINIESLKTVPMLFFISDGKETGLKEGEWEKTTRQFAEGLNVKIEQLNAGHYLHDFFPEEISNKSKRFIDIILNK